MVSSIDAFIGTFEGTGAWHDSAGQSQGYRTQQTNGVTADGFEVRFRHDFDDGSIVNAQLIMTWVTPNIFRVSVGGVTIGHGYVFDDYSHYHLETGGKFVEASYRASTGGLEVFGSSSKNADGNYIAWSEHLRRTSP